MKLALKYGFLIGFTGFIWNCIEFILGLQNAKIHFHFIITLLFPLALLFIFIRFLKPKKGDSYKNIFIFGMKISFFGAVFAVLFGWIFYTFVNKNFFDDIQLAGRDWIGKTAISEESFQNSFRMMQDIFTLKTHLIWAGILDLFLGLLFTLIIALFIRKK